MMNAIKKIPNVIKDVVRVYFQASVTNSSGIENAKLTLAIAVTRVAKEIASTSKDSAIPENA